MTTNVRSLLKWASKVIATLVLMTTWSLMPGVEAHGRYTPGQSPAPGRQPEPRLSPSGQPSAPKAFGATIPFPPGYGANVPDRPEYIADNPVNPAPVNDSPQPGRTGSGF